MLGATGSYPCRMRQLEFDLVEARTQLQVQRGPPGLGSNNRQHICDDIRFKVFFTCIWTHYITF